MTEDSLWVVTVDINEACSVMSLAGHLGNHAGETCGSNNEGYILYIYVGFTASLLYS